VPAPAPPWTVSPIDRSKIDYSNQPLWAWGVADRPRGDEKQAVQGGPNAAPANQNVNADELNRKRHLNGSRLEFSLADIRGNGNGSFVDWFPQDHPAPIPDIIRRGPAALGKDARPCGSCHLSDGSGRPENASPAGLPAGYITRQLSDFKNDLRHNADPRKGNSNTMVMLAKAMTDQEIKEAADYFASVKWRPHVQVVETKLVPKTHIQGELFIPDSADLREPIGDRIV
jgi:cytochrome c553